VDVLDFLKEPLALYNPDEAHDLPGYSAVESARWSWQTWFC
jgi:hypothetical protein